jgi:hypothetical protein
MKEKFLRTFSTQSRYFHFLSETKNAPEKFYFMVLAENSFVFKYLIITKNYFPYDNFYKENTHFIVFFNRPEIADIIDLNFFEFVEFLKFYFSAKLFGFSFILNPLKKRTIKNNLHFHFGKKL